jgi:hypothetical protein
MIYRPSKAHFVKTKIFKYSVMYAICKRTKESWWVIHDFTDSTLMLAYEFTTASQLFCIVDLMPLFLYARCIRVHANNWNFKLIRPCVSRSNVFIGLTTKQVSTCIESFHAGVVIYCGAVVNNEQTAFSLLTCHKTSRAVIQNSSFSMTMN